MNGGKKNENYRLLYINSNNIHVVIHCIRDERDRTRRSGSSADNASTKRKCIAIA